MLSRNDPCWCGSGQKYKKCHYPSLPPDSVKTLYLKQYGIKLKDPEQIDGIRKAGHLAANILTEVCKIAKAGVTTDELNDLSTKLHKEAGAIPAALGYGNPPFSKGICTSINEVVCHGIPGPRALVDGDIVNIDVTSILNGYYGDCSMMVAIGKIDDEKRRVVEAAYEGLMNSIKIIRPGVPLFQLAEEIEKSAAKYSCSVVYQFVGHGVGIDFHEAPQIPHHHNKLNIPLVSGMTFTIEPMINAGVPDAIIARDKWTASTADGKPSAQWEHTILVTDTGYEILTPWERK